MRKIIEFTIILTALIIFQPSSAHATQNIKAGYNLSLSSSDVIAAINGYRQQNGIASLTPNAILNSLAQGQSNYQASINTVTHTGPGGTTPQERASAAGYGGGNYFYLSEIIYGGNNQTVQNALYWWQNSSLHNSIMLDAKYTEVGAGVASNGEWIYFTAVLGGPTGDTTTGGSGDPGDTGSNENAQLTQPAQVIMPVQQATPQPDGSIIHTVLTGQTLWTIAAVYGLDLQTLLDNNNLNQYSYVFPGDKIIIRPPGVYENPDLTPSPINNATNLQGSGTPTEIPSQVLGLPYSSLKSTPTQSAITSTITINATTLTPTLLSPNSSILPDDPMARNLIIGAFIILMVVLIGSIFIQKPGDRPKKDDLLE